MMDYHSLNVAVRLTMLALLILPVGKVNIAHTATFAVNSVIDDVDADPGDGVCATLDGVCTLRAAIQEANDLAGPDVIDLGAGTYALTIGGRGEDVAATGDLDITDDLTLIGEGATSTSIDGDKVDRVLHVIGSVTVELAGLAIRNGSAYSDLAGGGGICNSGGVVRLIESTVVGNKTVGLGICGQGNTGSPGGGIYNEGGTVELFDSTVSLNTVGCEHNGGGIYNAGGSVTLTNSTISYNSGDYGGGIFNLDGGTVTLTNCTVSENTSSGEFWDYFFAGCGGGIYSDSGTVNMANTIVANNVAETWWGDRPGDCCQAVISGGHNLDSDGSCGLDLAKNDKPERDPRLGPLRDNGGPTETHALPPDSPAVDQGSCSGFTTDQRGRPRPVDILDIGNADDGCDIGAFEYQPGKIVVNNDEWTLSDEGFNQVPNDAAQFARNVANWFTGDQPGNFLVYSASRPSLTGVQFASTMANADHSLKGGAIADFSLPNLLQYDGIFLAGTPYHGYDPPHHQVLIDYVKAGGNIYLAGGTNPVDPAGEAKQWNHFLRACGLDFAPAPYQNDVDGVLKFNSSHRIFDGVQRLYQRDGNFIRDLDPRDPSGAILVHSEQGAGLYAVCTIGAAIESAPTAIDLLSFTAEPFAGHVTLAWQTGTEVDNAGFNLHRATSADGPYTKLNDALIPAEGDPESGASYTYTDTDVVKGVTYYYKLEDVDVHGVSTFHGPVSAMPGWIRRIYLPVVLSQR